MNVEDFKAEFGTDQKISENSIQSLFNDLGNKIFNAYISKARETKEKFSSLFDGIKYMNTINRVQSEVHPDLNSSRFTILISNGEVALLKKMYQLFSLKISFNIGKKKLRENQKYSYNELRPIFNRICTNRWKDDNANWGFPIYYNKEGSLEDIENFFRLFYCTFFCIAGHEFGEIYYENFPEVFQERSEEIEDFINTYMEQQGSDIKSKNIESWKKELFSDLIGIELAIESTKDECDKNIVYLACIFYFLVKDLCDKWFIKQYPTSLSITRIKFGNKHPSNNLRLKYLQNLLPDEVQQLSVKLIHMANNFLQKKQSISP